MSIIKLRAAWRPSSILSAFQARPALSSSRSALRIQSFAQLRHQGTAPMEAFVQAACDAKYIPGAVLLASDTTGEVELI